MCLYLLNLKRFFKYFQQKAVRVSSCLDQCGLLQGSWIIPLRVYRQFEHLNLIQNWFFTVFKTKKITLLHITWFYTIFTIWF